MTRNEQHHLSTANYHFAIALTHGQRDLTDQVTLDAISMRLVAGIDALNALSPGTRDAVVGDGWRAMWAMRNRIAHAYDAVGAEVLASTVSEDIPHLMERLEAVIAKE